MPIVQGRASISARSHQPSPKKLMCGTRRQCKIAAGPGYSQTTASEETSCIADPWTAVTNSAGRARVHATTYRG